MQSLANYRQTALEQMQNLAAIANTDVTTPPPTTEEVGVTIFTSHLSFTNMVVTTGGQQ